ncbi:PilN domain-containing protein [Benzoatithermus flavus]|uniref:PilN domain-containing protein n=1 Tax=Benzoatithermus flavus TaxID=3108223 RepID=A0ABU8XQ60_9PROT
MALTRSTVAAEQPEGFLAWWLGELQDMLPRRWRERSGRRAALLLWLERPFVRVVARRGQRLTPLGSFLLPEDMEGASPRDAAMLVDPKLRRAIERTKESLVLVLSQHEALTTTDLLPASAEDDLGRIMAHKIDLLTPWPAEQVYAAQRVVRRRSDGMLEVLLAAAPRATVDALRRRLAACGIAPTGIDVALDEGRTAGVDLLQAEGGERRGGWLARTIMGLVALALLAGAGWAGWQIYERQDRIAMQNQLVRGLEQRLADLPELRARISAMQAEADFLNNDRRGRPSPLVVLEVLSRLLPDTVWLSEVRLEDRELMISGMAEDASALIPLIERTPGFSSTRFQTPSTRVRITGPDGTEREVERFAISATVEPRVEAKL